MIYSVTTFNPVCGPISVWHKILRRCRVWLNRILSTMLSSLALMGAKCTCESFLYSNPALGIHCVIVLGSHISLPIFEAASAALTIVRFPYVVCSHGTTAAKMPPTPCLTLLGSQGLWWVSLMLWRGRLSCSPNEGAEFVSDQCCGGSGSADVCTGNIFVKVSSSDCCVRIVMYNKSLFSQLRVQWP